MLIADLTWVKIFQMQRKNHCSTMPRIPLPANQGGCRAFLFWDIIFEKTIFMFEQKKASKIIWQNLWMKWMKKNQKKTKKIYRQSQNGLRRPVDHSRRGLARIILLLGMCIWTEIKLVWNDWLIYWLLCFLNCFLCNFANFFLGVRRNWWNKRFFFWTCVRERWVDLLVKRCLCLGNF